MACWDQDESDAAGKRLLLSGKAATEQEFPLGVPIKIIQGAPFRSSSPTVNLLCVSLTWGLGMCIFRKLRGQSDVHPQLRATAVEGEEIDFLVALCREVWVPTRVKS